MLYPIELRAHGKGHCFGGAFFVNIFGERGATSSQLCSTGGRRTAEIDVSCCADGVDGCVFWCGD